MNEESEDDRLDAIAEEYLQRVRRGEHPALEEYIDRYPELAQSLREVLETLAVLHGAANGSKLNKTGEETVVDTQSLGPRAISDRSGADQSKLHDFEIISKLGAGGMGIVYEAKQLSLGRRVALKVVPPELLHNELAIRRFELEARTAAQLQHPHIVPVYDVGAAAGVHYYSMRLVRGAGLDQIIARMRDLRDERQREGRGDSVAQRRLQDGLPADWEQEESSAELSGSTSVSDDQHSVLKQRDYYSQVAVVGRDVASALAYSHARGVIHRDIKPSNLMLDGEGRIWVTDFGLAKTEGSDLTRTGDVVGTLRFMAPERFDGLCDRRGDIYSLGMTLYELISLSPALGGGSQMSLLRRIQEESPLPPRDLDPRLPKDLETIIVKSIAKDPAHRYQTAGEMADDLALYLSGRPIRARRVSLIERGISWARRNRTIAASLTTVAVLIICGLIGSTLAALQFREMAVRESELSQTAELARGDAERLAEVALKASRENRRNLYFAEMQLAVDAALQPTGLASLRSYLERWDPRAESVRREAIDLGNESDPRCFEWYWLKALAERETKSYFQADEGALEGALVAFHPVERWVAVTVGGEVFLVSLGDGSEVASYRLAGFATGMRFSADGRMLALGLAEGGWDDPGTLVVVEPMTGQVLHRRELEHSCVVEWCGKDLVATSIDNRGMEKDRLVVLSSDDWSVRKELVIDAELPTGELVPRLEYSAEENLLAVSMIRPAQPGVVLLDCDTWAIRKAEFFEGHTMRAMRWSHDGKRLAVTTYDRRVAIIASDASVERLAHTFDTPVASVSWTLDDRSLVLGCAHGSLRLVSSSDLSAESHLFKHERPVLWTDTHRQSGQLYSFSPELGLVGWDEEIDPFKVVRNPRPDLSDVLCDFEWHRSGRFFTCGNDIRTSVCESDRGTRVVVNEDDNWSVLGHAYGWDESDRLVSNFRDELVVWSKSITSREKVFQRPVFNNETVSECVAITPDGRWMLQTENNSFMRWGYSKIDLQTGELSVIRELTPGRVRGRPVLSPEGGRIAVGVDRRIVVVDVADGREILSKEMADYLYAVAWSPDGSKLAVGGEGRTITVMDSASGQIVGSMLGHTAPIWSLDWSPNEPRLASAADDHFVMIWDTNQSKNVIRMKHSAATRRVRWSPDGQALGVMGQDGVAWVLDARAAYQREKMATEPPSHH